jgi:Xaa-Pro aminopeptidase
MSFSLYAERRARVAAQLGAGGIALIPTAPERSRNRDNDFCSATTATFIT